MTSSRSVSRRTALAAASVVAAAAASAPGIAAPLGLPAQGLPAQGLRITLNGTLLDLDPGAHERFGRVFVPLRGVFEKLGASVVYRNGTIEAHAGRRRVALRVGSTAASLNGEPQVLDCAPFVMGSRAFVPLRCVAQMFGADVAYDAVRKSVAIVHAQVLVGQTLSSSSQPSA